MTIDVTIPRETKSLIRPLQRTFFPIRIPQQHHQLKNFISTTDPNIIYYASDHEVYALHLSAHKRELIATLPWEPQCLDASYGWICVGGPDCGRCAFICIGEGSLNHARSRDRDHHRHTEVDALLPLDLDPESRLLAHNFPQRSHPSAMAPGRRQSEVQIHEFGDSIVNSVTVYRLLSDRKGFEDEIVAVLTNNDHTIRIFSLSQSRVLDTLKFPTAMNHASISPDGKLLVAVGDRPQAFFCKRLHLTSRVVEGELNFAKYEWQIMAEPKLSLAHSTDTYFSTAFSPSGHICAVASEAGIITVFDTAMIRDEMQTDEAVLDVLRSSRPYLGRDKCGAVRSMSFAPAPWDLLAWAEDQGRVCVIDLRDAFRSRQTIELETDSPNLNRVSMSDLDDCNSTSEQRQLEIEARFLQRHREVLDAQDHIAAVSHAADYMELAAERRRILRETRDSRLDAPREEYMQFTESERQILDSIRISRLQENELARIDANQHTALSVNLNYVRSSSIGPPERQADPQPSINPSTPSSASHDASRGTVSIREYMRQRDFERNRTGDRSYQPRRTSSVVISNSSMTNDSSSSHPSSLAPIGTATPTLSASPSRLASATETTAVASPGIDPWQTIADAIGPRPGTHIADATTRLHRERDNVLARTVERRIQQQHQQQQQQAVRLERARNTSATMARLRQLHGITTGRLGGTEGLYDDNELDILRRLQETRGRREEGVGTMGIGWSKDGRNLYVGTEEGILEYTVNVDERKQFPAMALQ